MSDIIKIENLSKSFPGVKVLDGLSLRVESQSVFGVIGPNGAGKTTLFSLIAGFLRPDAGSIELFGERDLDKLRGRISILPQDARFQKDIPIMEQLEFFLRVSGWNQRDARAEIGRVLELVDFAEFAQRSPTALSHGQYKRLCLAQAFLGSPELIILDEPTTGLDPQSQAGIRDYIKKLRKTSTIVISSHDMGEMLELCDGYALLGGGAVVKSGSVEKLRGQNQEFRVTLGKPAAAADLAGLDGVEGLAGWELAAPEVLACRIAPAASAEAVGNAVLQRLLAAGVGIRELKYGNPLEGLYGGRKPRG